MSSQEVHAVENDLLPRFGIGERILCYRGSCLFAAKCEKIGFSDEQDTYIYFVHYWGWSRHWDEWLPENKILQLNDFNLLLQEEIGAEHKGAMSLKKRAGRAEKEWKKVDCSSSTTGLAETSRASTVEGERARRKGNPAPSRSVLTPVDFHIDDTLLDHIAEDWARINLKKKLVKLPASVTVDRLIDSYVAERSRTRTPFEVGLLRETAEGIKYYFNVMLQPQVLYELEFSQIERVFVDCSSVQDLSNIYGGIHLVRMLTRLGWAMGFTLWDSSGLNVLKLHIADFIDYIVSEADNIFDANNYVEVTEVQ